MSPADRKFAVDAGIRNTDQAWAEYVDFWIGVPGNRGIKLDWPATWRNRVRYLAKKVNGHHATAPRPGSREDTRERTVNVLDKLKDYARAHADDEGGGGAAGGPDVGLLPFGKLA